MYSCSLWWSLQKYNSSPYLFGLLFISGSPLWYITLITTYKHNAISRAFDLITKHSTLNTGPLRPLGIWGKWTKFRRIIYSLSVLMSNRLILGLTCDDYLLLSMQHTSVLITCYILKHCVSILSRYKACVNIKVLQWTKSNVLQKMIIV